MSRVTRLPDRTMVGLRKPKTIVLRGPRIGHLGTDIPLSGCEWKTQPVYGTVVAFFKKALFESGDRWSVKE